jgi:transposase
MRHHGIYDKPNLRMIVEGMLYRMRVGCPWRDLNILDQLLHDTIS